MKPTTLAMRPQPRPLCQLCEYMLRQPGHPRRFFAASTLLPATSRRPRASKTAFAKTVATQAASASTKPINSTRTSHKSTQNGSQASIELDRAKKLVKAILNSSTIPSEEESLTALRACESAAHLLTASNTNAPASPSSTPSSTNPTSALLTLEPPPPVSTAQIDQLSALAYSLLTHAPVFITPALLTSFVTTQTLLHRPTTLPTAFHLYAHKPIPKPGTNPPVYRPATP
ncbi:hypothetical protein AOQ84DRAFT_436536, partial [Glonium stellatum]